MYHLFDVEVAKEFGIEQAVVISNFQFWIRHNAANKKNFKNGKYWTYNSFSALAIIFPYWSVGQIKRIIYDLIKKKVLISESYNKEKFDKTNWYSFVDQDRWISITPLAEIKQSKGKGDDVQSFGFDLPLADISQPIPDTNSFINSDIISPPNGGEPGQVNFIIVPSGSDIEEKKKAPAKKEKKDPEEYWPALVKIWFDFYQDKKHEPPTFSPADSNHFKKVIQNLKKRAKAKGIEWTQENACNNLTHFLQYAYKVEWISQNFLISNILKQFDKIIADARGTNQPTTNNPKGQQPVDAGSAFSKFSALNSQPTAG